MVENIGSSFYGIGQGGGDSRLSVGSLMRAMDVDHVNSAHRLLKIMAQPHRVMNFFGKSIKQEFIEKCVEVRDEIAGFVRGGHIIENLAEDLRDIPYFYTALKMNMEHPGEDLPQAIEQHKPQRGGPPVVVEFAEDVVRCMSQDSVTGKQEATTLVTHSTETKSKLSFFKETLLESLERGMVFVSLEKPEKTRDEKTSGVFEKKTTEIKHKDDKENKKDKEEIDKNFDEMGAYIYSETKEEMDERVRNEHRHSIEKLEEIDKKEKDAIIRLKRPEGD